MFHQVVEWCEYPPQQLHLLRVCEASLDLPGLSVKHVVSTELLLRFLRLFGPAFSPLGHGHALILHDLVLHHVGIHGRLFNGACLLLIEGPSDEILVGEEELLLLVLDCLFQFVVEALKLLMDKSEELQPNLMAGWRALEQSGVERLSLL